MKPQIQRDEVLGQNLLTDHLSANGIRTKGAGKRLLATRCPATQHSKDHWCVEIDADEQIWSCHDCGTGGSIVDWIAIEKSEQPSHVYREMAERVAGCQSAPPAKTSKIVATYDYTDEHGEMFYQVVRTEPKSFRQRHPDDAGGWVWSMEGITRVLYRLPEVLKATIVYVPEGEKDVETLRKLGLVGTCNVGGAGKWMDAYSDVLKGKTVIVLPDGDEPGKKHAKQILDSLSGKAVAAKLVPMPKPHKDVSDFIASFREVGEAKQAFLSLCDKSPDALKPLPLFTMAELEQRYAELVKDIQARTLDLGKFLPSLGRMVRRLTPGQLAVILASTGVGKSAILQSIAKAAGPLPTVFFELELSGEDLFERFAQMQNLAFASEVEAEYKDPDRPPIYGAYRALNHILVCDQSGLTVSQMEHLIQASELKSGHKAFLVLVDYIGLIRSETSKSRYEAVSEVAEQLKVIAKRTNTVIVMASQIHRVNADRKLSAQVSLNDGKDSGSIENSAGLVIGAWRPNVDEMIIKILKNTKGRSGAEVRCNFDGGRMLITERIEPETDH